MCTPKNLHMPLSAAAVAALLALTACSGSEPDEEPLQAGGASAEADASPSPSEEEVEQADPDDYNHGEIPEEQHEYDSSELPEEPHNSILAPIDGEPDTDADRLAYRALVHVTSFAGQVDPDAEYHCPDFTTEAGTEVDCTVTFLGEEFTYSVELVDTMEALGLPGGDEDEDETGGRLTTWTDKNVFERVEFPEGLVLREVAESDMRHEFQTEYTICDMDDQVLVTPGELTGIRCSAIDPETGGAIDAELGVMIHGSLRWSVD